MFQSVFYGLILFYVQSTKKQNLIYFDLFLAAEAELSRCDMAEELSRQLEDILSTYCRENSSDDGSTMPNGQLHSPELNGLTNDKPEEGKVNGGHSGAEKDQKKTQEKKKVKGLGKE